MNIANILSSEQIFIETYTNTSLDEKAEWNFLMCQNDSTYIDVQQTSSGYYDLSS